MRAPQWRRKQPRATCHALQIPPHHRAAADVLPSLKKVDGKTVVQVHLLDNSVKQLLLEDWATAKVRAQPLPRPLQACWCTPHPPRPRMLLPRCASRWA